MNENQLPSTQEPFRPEYEDEINLVDIFNVLWRQRWLIVCITAISVIMATVYVNMKTPLYEITAQLAPKSRGLSETGKPLRILSPNDIAAWFSGGAYRELFEDDNRQLPTFKARVITKTKSVRISSLVDKPSEGLNAFDEIVAGILKGNVGFFSPYSDIEKLDMNEMIQKKQNTINALSLQQKRLNTVDKRKINSKIERANIKIEELKKRIDSIKKNKRQVQNTLEISLNQTESVNANTREVTEQRKKTVKENSDQIALLMYSNIIQQNIAIKNSLQQQILVLEKQINQYVDQEHEYSQEISRIKRQIQDLMLDRDESLALRNQEIVLQIKKNQMEIESIKAKLSIVNALEIIQHPKSSNSPVKPEKGKVVLISLFVGLFLSIIFSIFVQFILNNKQRIKTH